jgi:hypothetical protein
MSVLTSPKTYAGLAAFQAGDAVACAIPLPYIENSLDTLEVPAGVRPVLPVVKAVSAVGLLWLGNGDFAAPGGACGTGAAPARIVCRGKRAARRAFTWREG